MSLKDEISLILIDILELVFFMVNYYNTVNWTKVFPNPHNKIFNL